MNAFAGIRPKGGRNPTHLAFIHGVCSGGYLLSSGGLTPTTPRQFLPWCTWNLNVHVAIPKDDVDIAPDSTLNQVLRTRGHSFQLPTCSFNLHKKSFVISNCCLFKFLTWMCSFLCVLFFSCLDCFFSSNVLLISVYHV